MAVSLDVTDRVRAERGQHEAEERFQRAFEDSGVGMATARVGDGDDALIDVNDALCDLTGYPRDHLLRTGLEAVTHPDDVPAAQAALQRLLSGEEDSVQTEQRLMDREGRPIWVLVATSLVRDESGGTDPAHHPAAGRDRAQALRASAPAPRRPRPAHRAVQPAPVRGGAVTRAGDRLALRPRRGCASPSTSITSSS